MKIIEKALKEFQQPEPAKAVLKKKRPKVAKQRNEPKSPPENREDGQKRNMNISEPDINSQPRSINPCPVKPVSFTSTAPGPSLAPTPLYFDFYLINIFKWRVSQETFFKFVLVLYCAFNGAFSGVAFCSLKVIEKKVFAHRRDQCPAIFQAHQCRDKNGSAQTVQVKFQNKWDRLNFNLKLVELSSSLPSSSDWSYDQTEIKTWRALIADSLEALKNVGCSWIRV